MSYIALYRKWRPLVFEDVVEQEYVVKTLKNSIKSGRIAHAYLFCGSRGTGKTSIAKIFSRAINCIDSPDGDPCNKCEICKGILSGRNLDVIEIDAASNNGVDNIREIRDEVIYTPTESKYKVYIIDEVHMLSTGAFNALLKTLEEPPKHVVFILATTEPHKLPATILSRCQRFDFKRISSDGIVKRISRIAKENNCDLTTDAGKLIARLAEGGMRDAISILDQCISGDGKNIDVSDVASIVGIVEHTFVEKVADAILKQQTTDIFEHVQQLVDSGKDIKHFISEMVFYFRDLLVIKLTSEPANLTYPLYDDIARFKEKATEIDLELLIAIIKELSVIESSIKWSRNPKVTLEISLIKISERKFSDATDDLKSRIENLENKLATGSFTAKAGRTSETINNIGQSNIQSANNTIQSNAISPKKNVSSSAKEEISASLTSVSTSSGNKKSETPVEFWNDVILEAKSMGRMVVYTSLLDSAAYFIGSSSILIKPANAFNKVSLSKAENHDVVVNILRKRLGEDIIVKIASEKTESFLEEEKDDPIKRAKALAEMANIPFNIIDE